MLQAFAIVSSFSNRINVMDIMATVYWFRSETKSVLFLDSEAKNAASFTLSENLLATLFRALLRVFRNRITRNRRYSCSFGSYFVFGLNGISFRSFCSRKQNEQNERNTVNSEYEEYAFFWEIFGGKSNAAAHAGRLASGWKT